MGDPLVRCTVDRGVATITLASPATRNALSTALLADLHAALDRALVPDVRVAVLTHEAPVFCAGADLKERTSGPPDSTPMVAAIRRIQLADQPFIASVKGPVRAGGVGVMAACDLIVVAAAVDFAFTEVRLGVAPAIISVPILRRVSASRLAAAFLTGEPFGAPLALDIGLVTHVGEDADEVDRIVARLAEGVRRGAPGAVAATKRLLSEIPGPNLDEDFERMRLLSDSLFASDDGQEGMRSFLEKRPARWQQP